MWKGLEWEFNRKFRRALFIRYVYMDLFIWSDATSYLGAWHIMTFEKKST